MAKFKILNEETGVWDVMATEDQVAEVLNNLDALPLEYVEQRQADNLKVAKVEKELNDYKATMQQVNINQEPKQKATGYGIVSLPPNAANGQVSVTVKGNTETDEEGNTKSTISASRLKSVGKNLLKIAPNNVWDGQVDGKTTAERFRDYDIIIGSTRNGIINRIS